MRKAKEYFKGAKTKLTTAFHMFKRGHPFQHHGADIFRFSVHQETEVASDDSGTEQVVQQNAALGSDRHRSMLRYVITNYMDGSSQADCDSNLYSAGQQPEEGHTRADDNPAFHPLKSKVTFSRLSDVPDSEDWATTSGAANTNTPAYIPEAPEMGGQGANASGWTRLPQQSLRHRRRRSLSDWLETQVLGRRPTHSYEGRTVSISDAVPSPRHLSSGNSSEDTFGRWRNRRPNDGLNPNGASDPFLNRQPASEQREPVPMTLDDLDKDTPARWSADYDKFSSDGKQPKAEETVPRDSSLQPREYRLKTPPQRPCPERLNVRKRRKGIQSAAANAGVPEKAPTVAAENAVAHDPEADHYAGAQENAGAHEGNPRSAQPAPFQPGGAGRHVQAAMETMHRSFWQLDATIRQLDLENLAHRQNVRALMDRNRDLEQELERAWGAVRERDAELERWRGAVDIASQALRSAQLQHQNQQNGEAGNAPPPSTPQSTPPRTPGQHMLPNYAEGYPMPPLSAGSVDAGASSPNQGSSDDMGSVVHHQVGEQAYGFDTFGEESETSDMYGGDDCGGDNEGLDDEEGDEEDEGEDGEDGATGTPLSSAERVDPLEYRTAASDSTVENFELRAPSQSRP
ncbi:hypothetical protein CLAIMM_03307 [Cladophialophora immunda]|nr:hypothetical protein CLAIMM_03307 [Cladophialophora immunda]